MTNKGVQLADLLSDLPDFVFDFIKKHYDGESINTQIAYCIDIRTFLRYLKSLPEFQDIALDQFTPGDMQRVTYNMLLNYKAYLEHYILPPSEHRQKAVVVTNTAKGIVRKLSSLRSLYSYLFKADLIDKNVTEKLDLPKVHHRIKKPLTAQETLKLIDVVFRGEKYLSGKAKDAYLQRKQRDIAIFMTLLGTGIRVSELVGLNLSDLDFENRSFMVKRKGGEFQEIYMPLQVEEELRAYLEARAAVRAVEKEAVFLSNRGTRLTVSSIEKMIKRYCTLAGITSREKTTVHALRRTFACSLLEDGVDLKLVSELLGHRDISVTARFYAQHNKATHKRIMEERTIPLFPHTNE